MSDSEGGKAVTVIAVRDAIHAALRLWCSQTDPPIEVQAAYFSAEQFLGRRSSAPAPGTAVVVFDPTGDDTFVEFSALDRIVASGCRVIVYSHLATDEMILTSLEHGAVTCVAQTERNDHLISAIRAAWTAEPYVGPRMARALLLRRSVGRPNLAPREREVLIAWCKTHSKELVAANLDIAPATVRTHLQRIRAKYAAVGRAAPTKSALVARALQDGIISMHEV